jgi:hypothetical protein
MKKLLPALAAFAVIGAVVAGIFVWTASGDAARCDDAQLTDTIATSIASAERDGRPQVTFDLPEACDDDDVAYALPAVSRDWHAMPGGILMREASHTP